MMPDLRVFPMQAALALLVVWLPAVSSDSACSHLLRQVHSSGVKTTSSGIFFNATSSAKLDHHLPTASTMTSLPENHKISLRTNLFLSGHGSSASSMMPDLRVFPMQAALALLVVWLPAVSSDSACSHLLWQVHSSGVKTTSSGIFFNATSSAKLDHHLPRASTMTSLPENHKSSLRTNLFLSWHGSSASNMMPDLRVFPMQVLSCESPWLQGVQVSTLVPE
ncbi:uncharacterized protein LOC119173496 [Rhipicephalus microplus]|uniref:uncharacterized protein LOC119173496 n=1 Tax=Rhipicephalus microplus TaxID=6941 RepID=UPI003F6C1C54